MFALIDCNNFFVSCERLFRPDLNDKPVAVLSNNDGCFVARSKEVKALGIPMGAPAFEHRRLIQQHQIQLFSANFLLYSDISKRIMSLLQNNIPRVEVYSVDEAFLDFSSFTDPLKQGMKLKQLLEKWVGIPVSVGIGPTKTLAKLANDYAKHSDSTQGVFTLSPNQEKVFQQLIVEDVWGIGRQLTDFLHRQGIYTVWDLKNSNARWLKQHKSINLQRTILELNGIVCHPLNFNSSSSKSITTSRTFAYPVETKAELKKALARFAYRAAEKAREENLLATKLRIYLTTNYHQPTERQYRPNIELSLPEPTAYPPTLINYTNGLLEQIHRNGYRYKKAGVILSSLVPESNRQMNLFLKSSNYVRENQLSLVMDQINHRWGSQTIRPALLAEQKPANLFQRSNLSPRYTTHWSELPKVKVS